MYDAIRASEGLHREKLVSILILELIVARTTPMVVEVRHELSLYIVYSVAEACYKSVKVLFV